MAGALPRSWPAAASQEWAPGPWTFTIRGDELADIWCRDRLVARSIRLVVRDRDWNTVPLTVDSVAVTADRLEVAVRTDSPCADMVGHLMVETATTGGVDTARIRTRLLCRAHFETNRTGVVVLHPLRLAGTPLTVTTAKSGVLHGEFPEEVAPHHIATDITALGWCDRTVRIRMDFEGDVFEMEDQRNWTDASYKTYSRPLMRPFPYSLEAGTVTEQAVTITVDGTATTDVAAPHRETIDWDGIVLGSVTTFPTVGVAASTASGPAPVAPAPASDPAWATTLVELDLQAPTWSAALTRAAASGRPLDARVVVGETAADRLDTVVAALAPHRLERVTAFWGEGEADLIADERVTAALANALARAGIQTRVCAGVRSQFAELNREHHRFSGDVEGIVFSVSPFVHGSDTAQLVESVGVQRTVAMQAVRIAAGRDVHVGPISLRPHVNAVATSAEPRSSGPDLAEGYGPALLDAADERQGWPLTAAWTVASAAAMTVAGVASLTYFEEWGPRGVRMPDGAPLPALEALSALAGWQGDPVATGASDDGLVWVIASANGARVLAANLDVVGRSVQMHGKGHGHYVRLEPGSWSRFE